MSGAELRIRSLTAASGDGTAVAAEVGESRRWTEMARQEVDNGNLALHQMGEQRKVKETDHGGLQ